MGMMRNPQAMAKAAAIQTKVQMMGLSANWESYLSILTQAIGVGGILIFGFVASWIFGREYSEGTAKDLLSLPTSRTTMLNAKFILYGIWCLALTVSNLLVGLIIGVILQIPALDANLLFTQLIGYFLTALLTILPGTPIAFFALWGKGYLAPLGFVALTLVFAQVIAAPDTGIISRGQFPVFSAGQGVNSRHSLMA